MIQNAKQALHIESGKSFSRGEANENERRWDGRRRDEDEEAYRRRSFRAAMEVTRIHTRSYRKR